MSEPYFYPDKSKLSTCCGAPSKVEIVDDLGLCSKCGEWTDFEEEREEQNESVSMFTN